MEKESRIEIIPLPLSQVNILFLQKQHSTPTEICLPFQISLEDLGEQGAHSQLMAASGSDAVRLLGVAADVTRVHQIDDMPLIRSCLCLATICYQTFNSKLTIEPLVTQSRESRLDGPDSPLGSACWIQTRP